MTFHEIFHSCIRDRDGNVVLGESPNLPIIVAPITAVLAIFLPGNFRHFFGLIAFGAFFTWAWLEIFAGTTPLRRILGSLAMVALFVTMLFILKGNLL